MHYIKLLLLMLSLVLSFPPQQSAGLQEILLDMITVSVPAPTLAINYKLLLLIFKLHA